MAPVCRAASAMHPPLSLRHAERIIGTFRETLGPDVGIALDVGFHFKLGGAARLARALEPYDLMWLETETLGRDCAADHPRVHDHDDLHRREPLWHRRLPTFSRTPRSRHRHARLGLERDRNGPTARRLSSRL